MAAGIVVVHASKPKQFFGTHDGAATELIARTLAGLDDLEYGGAWASPREHAARLYVVPDDTMLAPDAAAFGIPGVADFYGGVVPHPLLATKSVVHDLVDAAARAVLRAPRGLVTAAGLTAPTRCPIVDNHTMRASATGIARLDFVRPDLLPERLADHLREAIVDGRLKPGQRLVEQQLAGEWRVSRAPLREALRMLAVEGLVTLSPHRGATVTEVSATELEELFAVRGLLESFAAACAAARKPHAELERMHAILDDMRGLTAKADLAGYYRLAADFHDALVHASGNSVLARLHDLVKRQFRRYQAVMVRLPDLPRHSISEHGRIVRAIEAASATQASTAATRHVTSLMRQFRRHERISRGRPT